MIKALTLVLTLVFEKFKDRQQILSASRLLKDTPLSVSEDFCEKTNEIRKGLVPAMMQARSENKFAKLSYRTLVVRAHRERAISENVETSSINAGD